MFGESLYGLVRIEPAYQHAQEGYDSFLAGIFLYKIISGILSRTRYPGRLYE